MGDRDAAAGTVSVRLRDDRNLGAMPVDQFVDMAKGLIESRSLELTPAEQQG
jgi:threonyl-tRNA synthetase